MCVGRPPPLLDIEFICGGKPEPGRLPVAPVAQVLDPNRNAVIPQSCSLAIVALLAHPEELGVGLDGLSV